MKNKKSRTRRDPGQTEVPPAPRKPQAKFSIKDAFNYFYVPDGEGESFNQRRCVSAVAYLLHFSSKNGNENVDGFLAHGLGRALEFCAEEIGKKYIG